MLIFPLAHVGRAIAPHDLWSAWTLDPLLLLGLGAAAWTYRRGRTGRRARVGSRWRARCFAGALSALAVALVSPLDALSGALASAHMVQHLLLVLVAAPLLALSAPTSTLLRGSPERLRRTAGRWGGRVARTARAAPALRHPVTALLLHTGTLWFWHAAGPYGAALEHRGVHVVEHATFVLTGALFWQAVMGRPGPARVPDGRGVLLMFAMGMQSVFLSLLLTFAESPWYSGYTATTAPWGLQPLADQQLAGVIMWIPGGMVHLAAGLALLAQFLQASERLAPAPVGLPGPVAPMPGHDPPLSPPGRRRR